MAGPYSPFLIFGTVKNSISKIVPNAQLRVQTTVASQVFDAGEDGVFSFDLAEIGYVSGETITIKTKDTFDNELVTFELEITGFFAQITINLELRILVTNISQLGTENVLHSIGKKPITRDNPLSVTQDSTLIFEDRRAYNGSGQVEFIGEADPGSQEELTVWRIQKRTYVANRLTKISWANFNVKFDKAWAARDSYDYR